MMVWVEFEGVATAGMGWVKLGVEFGLGVGGVWIVGMARFLLDIRINCTVFYMDIVAIVMEMSSNEWLQAVTITCLLI